VTLTRDLPAPRQSASPPIDGDAAELPARGSGRMRRWLIGGGVVTIAVVAAAALGGGLASPVVPTPAPTAIR
jgi:hypothetical protein